MSAQSPSGRDFAPPTAQTLSRCDDEPIHLPGAVQPQGCLFEVRGEELCIGCVSSNLREVLGLGTSEVLDQPLADVLGSEVAAWIHRELPEQPPAAHLARRAQTPAGREGTVVVHHYMRRRIVEWLADAEHRYPLPEKIDQYLAATLQEVGDATDLQTAVDRIAAGVKAATGYDRVMVYRFHPDWHGEIVAEITEPGMPAYKGLHYPASDIPAQARRLYVETRIRVITDVYARDAVLMDAGSDDVSASLDLSQALLRSVSPVHIQYLRNMGSGGTLVTSLMIDGKLWGLIACHHRTRYPMPYYAFARLRQFTDGAAAGIAACVSAVESARQRKLSKGREQLAASLDSAPGEALRQLKEILGCEGIIAYAGGRAVTVGKLPAGAMELPKLVLGQPEDIGHTDAISERFKVAPSDASCAGLAWVVLSHPYQAVVIFVRPEFQQTVTWGGDPEKAVVRDPVTKRLSPRGSFDLWKQTVSGRSRPWEKETAELLEFFRQRADVVRWVKHIESSAS